MIRTKKSKLVDIVVETASVRKRQPGSEVVKNTKLLMINQLVIGVILTGLFWFKGGDWAAISAFFGMSSALVIAAILAYGVIRANRIATEQPQRSMLIIYFGAAQGFVLVIALFMIGLGLFKLDPMAMAATFGLTQLAYTINLRQQAKV